MQPLMQDGPKFDLPEILRTARSDPLQAIGIAQVAMTSLEITHRAGLCSILSVVFAAHQSLERDPKAWSKFVKDPFWQRRRIWRPRRDKDSHRMLAFVMRFVCNIRTKQRYGRAHKYARILEMYAEEEREATEIPSLVEEHGGIDAAYKRAVLLYPKKPNMDDLDDENILAGLDIDDEESTSKTDDKETKKKKRGMDSSAGLDSTKRRGGHEDEYEYDFDLIPSKLEVRLSERRLGRIQRLKDGATFWMKVRCSDDVLGLQEFVVVRMKHKLRSSKTK